MLTSINTCIRKVAYPSGREAKKGQWFLKWRYGKRNWYKCNICGLWHLTSRKADFGATEDISQSDWNREIAAPAPAVPHPLRKQGFSADDPSAVERELRGDHLRVGPHAPAPRKGE